jgi:hypothetical protein
MADKTIPFRLKAEGSPLVLAKSLYYFERTAQLIMDQQNNTSASSQDSAQASQASLPQRATNPRQNRRYSNQQQYQVKSKGKYDCICSGVCQHIAFYISLIHFVQNPKQLLVLKQHLVCLLLLSREPKHFSVDAFTFTSTRPSM